MTPHTRESRPDQEARATRSPRSPRSPRTSRGPRSRASAPCKMSAAAVSASVVAPFGDDKEGKGNLRRQHKKKKGPVQIIDPTAANVEKVPHYTEYSDDELASIWFTQKEIDQTISECKETVRCMQDGIPLAEDDDHAFTTRGLEYMTASGFDITTNSLDAVKLVLKEQERQRVDFEPEERNPDLLKEAMEGISMHRMRIAHLAAMKDARAVYGDGNFKTTIPENAAPMRSRSFTRRSAGGSTNGDTANDQGQGAGLVRAHSLGNLRRSRRGSRGQIPSRRERIEARSNRSRSDPSSSAIQIASEEVSRGPAAAAVAAEFGL